MKYQIMSKGGKQSQASIQYKRITESNGANRLDIDIEFFDIVNVHFAIQTY